jgi:hypothetical protein
MTVEVENTGPTVGFLDPECLCSTTLNSTDNTLAFSVPYMLNAFKQYATKDLMLTAYLSTNHWIAVAIVLKQQKVYYLDSLKTIFNRRKSGSFPSRTSRHITCKISAVGSRSNGSKDSLGPFQ